MNKFAWARLHDFMEDRGFNRFFIYRPENFAWLTGGGDNTVVIGEGMGYLEVSAEEIRLHIATVEAARLREEEKVDFKIVDYPWYSSSPLHHPNDIESDLTPLRLVLSPEEQDRFRRLGRDTAVALGKAMRAARPEWTELQLAGAIANEAYQMGIQPVVLLVAGENRVFKYRHPLPKPQPLGKRAMGVICGRRDGLVANVTRMRVWGNSAAELHNQVLQVEAGALAASVPGRTVGEVIAAIEMGYREIGHEEAFFEHHQGGIAGYRPREVLATREDGTVLQPGMAVAWNPSLPGAKVEDTFLITTDGLENLTVDPDWPMIAVEGRARPQILTDSD